ncbi:NAD(P)/FAD-dependent oxidoreductase [Paenalcaligenes sp. Me52]|uniref:NAD(P)/FAD-dependent oxidoreductase n=1 Tax=Paenalcaligenes sp. Me52 TaxID=3392038 RepID=UPI003D271598
MTAKPIVIIGAGQAGAWAARTLRTEGYTGAIVLIGQEAHPPYERPPLSKEFLLGNSEFAQHVLLAEEELQSLHIQAMLGCCVQKIDREQQQLYLDNGTTQPYGRLILATGGRAVRPTLSGVDHDRVVTLRTVDDAKRLQQFLQAEAEQDVVVVGGGWIGLEVAATLNQQGHHVSIVEFASQVCQRSVDAALAAELLVLHRRKGNRFYLNAAVIAIEQVSPTELEVVLSDGQRLKSAVVVLAVGMKANDELAAAAGLHTDGGVVVNEFGCTSDPLIYAAGDIARTPCSHTLQTIRHESWQNAKDQAQAVAKAMLGKAEPYTPLLMLWSEQFEWMLQVAGMVKDAHHTVERAVGNIGKLIFYAEATGVIVGVAGINAGREFRWARMLVEARVAVLHEQLSNPTEPLPKLLKEVAHG